MFGPIRGWVAWPMTVTEPSTGPVTAQLNTLPFGLAAPGRLIPIRMTGRKREPGAHADNS